MSEQRLLSAALADRDSYELIAGAVAEGDVSPLADQMLKHIGRFYAKGRVLSIDRESFAEWLALDVANPKHVQDFVDMVAILPEVGSPGAVAAILHEQKLRAVRMKLASALQAGDPVEGLLAEYEKMSNVSVEVLPDLSDREEFMASFEDVQDGNRIRLWPKTLQKHTGGALPGHHIVLYGRPERGKTLVTVNMVAGFLYDQHKVLYIGNEDPIASVKARITSRLVGTTYEDFTQMPGNHYERAVERGVGRLHAERLDPGNVNEIESLINRAEPDILVVDQLRNLHPRGSKNDSMTQRIDTAAQEIRSLLGKYNLLGVSIAQAGAGEGGMNDRKAFLEMSDLDQSKTGLPGACDLMMGLGATDEMVANGTRGISLVKNKLNGDHARFLVRVDIQRNRVE